MTLYCDNPHSGWCCRPGHGAPTQDIRKKKFTEHQMDQVLYCTSVLCCTVLY